MALSWNEIKNRAINFSKEWETEQREHAESQSFWNDLKTKLQKEGSELSEKIGQLKMKAPDGKMWLTDIAKEVAFQGGNVARLAKEELESKTGKKVVTSKNAKDILENQKKIR